MVQSQEIGELAKALVLVQSVLEGAELSNTNPFYKSKYADLSSVWNACRKPLAEQGLSVVQTMHSEGEDSYVETLLMHTSGQFIGGRLKLELGKKDMQALGSAITYARRYSLQSIVGICPEDDDAESTMDRKEDIKKPKPKKEENKTKVSTMKEQVIALGKKLFDNPDEFKLWRIDNALQESLSKCSDYDLAKIYTKLQQKGIQPEEPTEDFYEDSI